MCGITAIGADLRVSIQAYGAPDLGAGHLAVGLLLDSDVVLIPVPPPQVYDSLADLEMVVIPVPPRAELAIERFLPFKLVTIGVGDAPPLAALVTLQSHSRYASQVGHVPAEDLRRALLDHDGDFVDAFVALGVLRPEQVDIPRDLLAEAGKVERIQRDPRRSDLRADTLEGLLNGWCPIPFICICEPN